MTDMETASIDSIDQETLNNQGAMVAPEPVTVDEKKELTEEKDFVIQGANDGYTISNDCFRTPTMGDFYLGAVDDVYMKKIDAMVNAAKDNGNGEHAAFYTEDPAVKDLGHENGLFYVKANVSVDSFDIDNGFSDGRTLLININNCSGNEKAISDLAAQLQTGNNGYDSLLSNNSYFFLKLLGISCPETPKWAYEYDYPATKLSVIQKTAGEASKLGKYIFVENLYDESKVLSFADIYGKWREIDIISQDDNKMSFRWLMDAGQLDGGGETDGAYVAANKIKELIDNAGNEIYILMEDLNCEATDISAIDELCSSLSAAPEGCIYKTGYARCHAEKYRQFTGAAYIKQDGKFINLAKAALMDRSNLTISPDTSYAGDHKDIFDLQSYDFEKKVWADSYFKVIDEIDDRRKIQKDILQRDFDGIKKWTVVIGDTTLFVPPTNISCISTIENEAMPMLRAKGSALKGGHRTTRKIQLEIYFNEDRGINGHIYKTKLPNDAEISYSMNGLRSLIAQFKFTPIIPIENEFINETLGIEAILFNSIQISYVRNYPKLYKVTLTVSEFDFGAYMPELYTYAAQNNFEDRNIFSASINWPVMRYYYQKAIRKGDDLAKLGYAYNTKEYNSMMTGNRTTLVPMKFKSNDLKFFVANKEYMDEMLAAKLEALNGKQSPVIDFADDQIDAMKKLGVLSKAIGEAIASEEFTAIMRDINNPDKKLKFNGGISSVLNIDNGSKYPTNDKGAIKSLDVYWENDKYKTAELMQLINEAVGVIRNHVEAVNQTIGTDIISKISVANYTENTSNKSTISFGLTVEIGTDYLSVEDNYIDLKNDASNYVGEGTDKFFKDYKLFIPISSHNEDGGSISFSFDKSSPDMKFLEFCESADKLKDDAEEVKKRRSVVNLNQLDNLEYEEYKVGNVRIIDFSAALSNHTSTISIQNYSGISAQYLGGEDTAFTFVLQTTSKDAAKKICALPQLSAQYARDYHLVLPYYPLRIHSEISAFLGVNEVVIESAKIETGNDSTGVYTIQLNLRSVDRTLRDRESMVRAEIDNFTNTASEERVKSKVRSFFQIKSLIAKAELYPDLELPTLKEMKKVGYDFLRYKFQDERKYVDPDFYFIYPYVIGAQIMRELALNGMENGVAVTSLTDKAGASIKITPDKFRGYSIDEKNDAASEQMNKIADITKTANAQQNKKLEENIKKSEAPIFASGEKESWAICDDISAMFLEKKYKKEYNSYTSRVLANKVAAGDDTNKNAETVVAEGKWVNEKLKKAQEAANEIQYYLENTYINESAEPMSTADTSDNEAVNYADKIAAAKSLINVTTRKFLSDPKIESILAGIEIDTKTDKFVETVCDIVYAAACAATGEKEYADTKTATNWQPDFGFKAMVLGSVQDLSAKRISESVQDTVDNGIMFGCFKIKQYSQAEIRNITGENIDPVWTEESSVNTSRFLLDPYYRQNTLESIKLYKKGCVNNPAFCAVAFLRLMLYWLKRLIDSKAIPTITNDILRGAAKNEMAIMKKEMSLNIGATKSETQNFSENISFFNKQIHAIDAGKLWTAAVLAVTDGDSDIISRIETRDYKGLNGYVQSASNPKTHVNKAEKSCMAVRKMTLALVGMGRIDKINAAGSSPTNPATEYIQNAQERKYIEAAEDPNQLIPHSFHDMIVNDARGRMLRAFPTFYVVFIDEGREIGMWRLHDNFYTTSAIIDMQIVKSRKMPADTATIKMSNFYQSYTTDNEGALKTDPEGWGDAFDSIFSPTEYAKKQEEKRLAAPREAKIRLRAGARIHIRAGYGSSAVMLPVLFNGSIAEVSAEDVVELTAQGDGIELMNPIIDIEEAHEVRYQTEEWYVTRLNTNGGTPKQILTDFLSTKGGWVNKLLKDTNVGKLLDCNPYGIYHFGDPDLNVIHKVGETAQNIYEAVPRPFWGDMDITNKKDTVDPPKITLNVFKKTIWDVANSCKSVTPDFICAVAPFQFRSTIFMGLPRYYYAYDYEEANGGLVERRKPYEQYHIYTSYSDIIANGMAASSQKMKTVAMGMYETDFGTGSIQRKTDPIMADVDIYPENQKTMVVDTRLLGKGVPCASGVTSEITSAKWLGTDFSLDDLFDDEGSMVSHKKIAWRMTASALRESMMDMYCGDIVVLGDASVKPFDRVFLADTYQGFTGQVGVKEVVHHFNVNDGFITTISPDCIVRVDDNFEPVINGVFNRLGSFATGAAGLAKYFMLARVYAKVPTIAKGFTKLIDNKLVRDAAGKVIDAGDIAAGKIKDLSNKALEKVVTDGSATDKAIKNAAEKTKDNIKNAKKVAKGIKGTIAGLRTMTASTVVGLPLVALQYAASYIITNSISAFVENKLKNLNAVTVFPVERYNLPYVAGLGGSKGLIVSEHANTDKGTLKKTLANLVSSDNPILNTLQSLFYNEDAMAAADKLKRDVGIIDSSGSPTTSNDVILQKHLQATSQSSGTSDYRSLAMSPRASYDDQNEIATVYQDYAITDTEKWQVTPSIKNNSIISDDVRFKPYIDEQFFYILHETPTLNKGKNVNTQIITSKDGSDDYVKVIEYSGSDGNPVYDVAMLNKDAINILYEIIRRTKNNMPSANASDPNESYEATKGSYVVLKSALRVGDKESFASTGFTFILQGTEEAINPLSTAIDDLVDEIKNDATGDQMKNKELFKVKKYDGSTEIGILVNLPKKNTNNIHENTSGE